MAKRRWKVDDLKRCGCGAVFLTDNCPFCGETTWNFERGGNEMMRMALFDQCVNCTKKGARNAVHDRFSSY